MVQYNIQMSSDFTYFQSERIPSPLYYSVIYDLFYSFVHPIIPVSVPFGHPNRTQSSTMVLALSQLVLMVESVSSLIKPQITFLFNKLNCQEIDENQISSVFVSLQSMYFQHAITYKKHDRTILHIYFLTWSVPIIYLL